MDSECLKANDFISISVKNSSRNDLSISVNLASQKEENKWIENYFEFNVENNEETKNVGEILTNQKFSIINLIKKKF